MANLMTYLKEQGLTHAEVIKMIEERNATTPEDAYEATDGTAPEPVIPEVEAPEETGPEEPETPELEKAVQQEIEIAEKEETDKAKAELKAFNKKVAAEVRKQLSTKRKTPSKGEINDGSKITPEVIKRHWFEKIV